MSITIYPNTGTDHIAFVDGGGRQYIIDRAEEPEVAKIANGTPPDASLISTDFFMPDDGRLLVTGFEPDGQGGALVEAEGIPHDLTLSPAELASLAQAMRSA